MAFDPTLPLDHANLQAPLLRGQFNALNDKIDAMPAGPAGPQGAPGEVSVADLQAALVAERPNSAKNPSGVAPLGLTVSDPPTQAEMQAIVTWNNALLVELTRQP